MEIPRWSAALVLAGALGTAQAEVKADPNLARDLAATCANCHGTDGRPVPGSGSEALAGMEKDKLMQKLRDFRTGARPATIMQQIAKGYTEAQLETIAAYFAARK